MLMTTRVQVAFAAVVATALMVQGGGLLRLAYPLAAVAIGWRLSIIDPPRYLAFLLWLWALTPLVRRIADFQAGWQDPSLVLLTPYVVTAACLLRPLARAVCFPTPPASWPPGRAMFVLAGVGVACGVPLGLVTDSTGAAIEMLNWVLPIGLGIYVASRHQELVELERAVVRALAGIVIVVGAYGVAQFVNPLPWDVDWMKNAEMASIGQPEPFAVRVFSTMHSPGVLAFFVHTALIVWLATARTSGLVGASLGMIVLLLSQVRTGWLALAISMCLVLAAMPLRSRIRALALAGAAALVVGPFFPTPEASDLLVSRAESLTESPSFDRSTASRLEGHGRALDFASRNPFGVGIGVTPAWIEEVVGMRDSTLVAGLVQLGVLGTVLYLAGLCLLAVRLWRYYRDGQRREAVGLACAGLGILCTAGLGVPTAGPPGMLVWMLAGLAAANATARQRQTVPALRLVTRQDRADSESYPSWISPEVRL